MPGKRLAFIAAIIGLLFSRAVAFAGEAEKYFPLAVGNTWVFQGDHYGYTGNYTPVLLRVDTLTVRIRATKEIGGNIWYRLENGIFGFDGFFRTEGNFVFQYWEQSRQEGRIYDFTPFDYSVKDNFYFMEIDGLCASPRELKR